jgi:trans-aconitate methyltransferase
MDSKAQTFWLENLTKANRYNDWIFTQIVADLGENILEVGCGNGNFTELLASQCHEVTAIDINPEYIQLAQTRLKERSRIKLLVADVSQIEWQEQFNTIIMLDVLEHIEAELTVLKQLNSSLKPGGKLIIKVPALTWLYNPMDRAINHYRRYNKRTLKTTLTQAGFVIPKIWYFNLAGIPGWWFNGQVLKRTIPPTQQIGFFNQLVPILSKIETTIKLPLGLSLFAVAVKLVDC